MLKTLFQIPRILATGFCFAYFFLGGMLISVTLFPIISLLPISAEAKQRKARYCVHKTFAQFVAMMEFFHLIKVTVHGIEKLQNARSGLVIANHPTLIDVVIMISKMPNAGCVVKGELFRNPYLKGVVSSAGFISNDHGETMLEGAKKCLDQQLPIVIFPEGSRSVPNEPLQFKRGTANIAVRTNAPVLPVFITCKPITLTKGAPWWAVPERRAEIHFWVQDWLPCEHFAGDLNDPPAAARRMTKQLQTYFDEGLKHVG